MSDVQRWQLNSNAARTWLEEDEDGMWVKFSDYAQLQADLATANDENERYEQNFAKRESHWIRENARLQTERDSLKSRLEEAGTGAQ